MDKPVVLCAEEAALDAGRPRSVRRPDGKIVTLYYFPEKQRTERLIAATVWDSERGRSYEQMSDWIEYLETVDTPTLSNAIELLNVRGRDKGFTPLDLKCLFPEFGRMCGYAVTAQVETMTTMEPIGRAGFPVLFDALASAPKPSVVVFQDVGGFRDYAAHCGEVLATIFTTLGSVGVVSDCGVRDVAEVRALGMHYFARGKVASHAHFRVLRTNVPVQVCGMTVRPGDLLHGDENGLITVPDLDRARLREMIDDVRCRERRLMEYVRSDDFTLDGLREKFLE